MRSNFQSPLRIVDGVVKARGKFEWETGEKQALVSVSITQRARRRGA